MGHKHVLKVRGSSEFCIVFQCDDCKNTYDISTFIYNSHVLFREYHQKLRLRQVW